MKSRILNHLDDVDRKRITRALQATVEMLPDIERLYAGAVNPDHGFVECRLGRSAGTEEHAIHLMVDDERTLLEHEVLIDGTWIHTTVIEEVIWPPRADSKRIADASTLVRGWLADVEQVDDEGLAEAYRSAERIGSAALMAAACRYDDGWSLALATMGWRTSEACIMLDYDDGRCPTRFCASGEEPDDGTLSIELWRALQTTTPVRNLVAERTIFDPGPIFTFGPPPIIRIRSADVSHTSRLRSIGDAYDQGLEIIPIDRGHVGGE